MPLDTDENEGLSDLTSDEISELAEFDADISPDEIKLLEEAAATRDRLHQHKLCLLAMTSSSQMLKDLRRANPEEFDAMFDAVDSFQEYAKSLSDVSQRAYYRMLVIGSLTDEELDG